MESVGSNNPESNTWVRWIMGGIMGAGAAMLARFWSSLPHEATELRSLKKCTQECKQRITAVERENDKQLESNIALASSNAELAAWNKERLIELEKLEKELKQLQGMVEPKRVPMPKKKQKDKKKSVIRRQKLFSDSSLLRKKPSSSPTTFPKKQMITSSLLNHTLSEVDVLLDDSQQSRLESERILRKTEIHLEGSTRRI